MRGTAARAAQTRERDQGGRGRARRERRRDDAHGRGVDGGGHEEELHHGRDVRDERPGDARGDETRVAAGAGRHRGDGGRAGDESRRETGKREADVRAGDAQRDVARRLERDEEHDERPQAPRIDAAEPRDRHARHERQHDERRAGEEQRVVELVGAEEVGREPMQLRARGEDRRDDDRGGGRERRPRDRRHAEQEREEERELGRDAGVARARAAVLEIPDRRDRDE